MALLNEIVRQAKQQKATTTTKVNKAAPTGGLANKVKTSVPKTVAPVAPKVSAPSSGVTNVLNKVKENKPLANAQNGVSNINKIVESISQPKVTQDTSRKAGTGIINANSRSAVEEKKNNIFATLRPKEEFDQEYNSINKQLNDIYRARSLGAAVDYDTTKLENRKAELDEERKLQNERAEKYTIPEFEKKYAEAMSNGNIDTALDYAGILETYDDRDFLNTTVKADLERLDADEKKIVHDLTERQASYEEIEHHLNNRGYDYDRAKDILNSLNKNALERFLGTGFNAAVHGFNSMTIGFYDTFLKDTVPELAKDLYNKKAEIARFSGNEELAKQYESGAEVAQKYADSFDATDPNNVAMVIKNGTERAMQLDSYAQSPTMKLALGVDQSIANMTPHIVTGTGLYGMGVQVYADTFYNDRAEGYDIQTSALHSALSAANEVAWENVWKVLPVDENALGQQIAKVFDSDIGKAAMVEMASPSSEFVEEFGTSITGHYIDKLVLGKEDPLNLEEAVKDGMMGYVQAAVMQLPVSVAKTTMNEITTTRRANYEKSIIERTNEIASMPENQNNETVQDLARFINVVGQARLEDFYQKSILSRAITVESDEVSVPSSKELLGLFEQGMIPAEDNYQREVQKNALELATASQKMLDDAGIKTDLFEYMSTDSDTRRELSRLAAEGLDINGTEFIKNKNADYRNAMIEIAQNNIKGKDSVSAMKTADWLSMDDAQREEARIAAKTVSKDSSIDTFSMARLEPGVDGYLKTKNDLTQLVASTDQGIVLSMDKVADYDSNKFWGIIDGIAKDIGTKEEYTEEEEREIKRRLTPVFMESGQKATIVSTVVHEVTHFIEQSKDNWNALKSQIKAEMGEERYNEALKRLDTVYKLLGVNDANAESELVAHYIQENIANLGFLARISKYNNSAFYRLYRNLKSALPGNSKTVMENTFMDALRDANRLAAENTGELGLQYSAGLDSVEAQDTIENKIYNSMSMSEARRMLEKTWNQYKDDYDEKTLDEFLKNDPDFAAEQMELLIENTFNLQDDYVNSNEDILNGEYSISDIVKAYLDGKLKNENKSFKLKDIEFADGAKQEDTFFTPKDISNPKDLLEIANQRMTKSNEADVLKARADLITYAHNPNALNELGMTNAELNKKIRSWSRYSAQARATSEALNRNVPEQYRWSGLENSNNLNKYLLSNDANKETMLKTLVKSISGKFDSWSANDLVNTMLSIDSHINYKDLSIVFDGNDPSLFTKGKRSANGTYNSRETRIAIGRSGLGTLSHETGHFIDNLWGRELSNLTDSPLNMYLSEISTERLKTGNASADAFIDNFKNFIDKLSAKSDIRSDYTQRRTEVFARFVDHFTAWVNKTAGGYGDQTSWYKDNFNTQDCYDFVKLLQQKSMLNATVLNESQSKQFSVGVTPQMETEYDTAVENNDMETAQRLVEEAATNSGAYKGKNGMAREFYHGTNNDDFTEFDPSYIASASGDTGYFGKGFYFAFSEGEARYYGKNVIKAYLNIKNPFNYIKEFATYKGKRTNDYNAGFAVEYLNLADKFPSIAEKEKIKAVRKGSDEYEYISAKQFAEEYKNVIENKKFEVQEIDGNYGKEYWAFADRESIPFEVDGKTMYYDDWGYKKRYLDEKDANDQLMNAYYYLAENVYDDIDLHNFTYVILENNDEFTDELKKRGYDGVIQSEEGDEIVAFTSEQIKNSDPVTYDDDGNVIPLSERFDYSKKDRRYSMGIEQNDTYTAEDALNSLDKDGEVYLGSYGHIETKDDGTYNLFRNGYGDIALSREQAEEFIRKAVDRINADEEETRVTRTSPLTEAENARVAEIDAEIKRIRAEGQADAKQFKENKYKGMDSYAERQHERGLKEAELTREKDRIIRKEPERSSSNNSSKGLKPEQTVRLKSGKIPAKVGKIIQKAYNAFDEGYSNDMEQFGVAYEDVADEFLEAANEVATNGEISKETMDRLRDILYYGVENVYEPGERGKDVYEQIKDILKTHPLSNSAIGQKYVDYGADGKKHMTRLHKGMTQGTLNDMKRNGIRFKNGGYDLGELESVFKEAGLGQYFDERTFSDLEDFNKTLSDLQLTLQNQTHKSYDMAEFAEETEESFNQFFDETMKQFVEDVSGKQMSDQAAEVIDSLDVSDEEFNKFVKRDPISPRALENITKHKKELVDTAPEWIPNYDIIREKHPEFTDLEMNDALFEILSEGTISERTAWRIKEDMLRRNSVQTNNEADQSIKDLVDDSLDYFAADAAYKMNKKAMNSVANKANTIIRSFTGQNVTESALDSYEQMEGLEKTLKQVEKRRGEVSAKNETMVKELLAAGADYGSSWMTLEQNLDKIAGTNSNLRQTLRDYFELPKYESQIKYVQFLKKYGDTLQGLVKDGIRAGTKESAAVQYMLEGHTEDGAKYGQKELMEQFPKTWEKLDKAAKTLRNMYDEMYNLIETNRENTYGDIDAKYDLQLAKARDKANNARRTADQIKQKLSEKADARLEAMFNRADAQASKLERQYEQMLEDKATRDSTRRQKLQYRKNYAHHLTDQGGFFKQMKNALSDGSSVPTKLSGISNRAKPLSGFASFFQRQNAQTGYVADAIGGMAEYIKDASKIYAYDPYIEYLRFAASDIRAEASGNEMSRFVSWVDNYANGIAGKTQMLDRGIRETFGEKPLKVIKTLNNQARKNAIVGNLSTALVQFANLPNAIGVLSQYGGAESALDIARGLSAYASTLGRDGAESVSPFMSARYYDINTMKGNVAQRSLNGIAKTLLEFGDHEAAKMIWNCSYQQALRLNVDDPVMYADDLTRRSVAGRSVSELPLAMESQVLKLLMPFQVETNNTFHLMTGLMRDKKLGSLLAMLIGGWLMNGLYEAVIGRRPITDPIDAIIDGAQSDNPADIATRLGGELLSAIPGSSYAVSLFGLNDNQRKKLFGENDPSRYGTGNIGLSTIGSATMDLYNAFDKKDPRYAMNAVSDLASTYLAPGGGRQIQRTVEGMQSEGMIPQYVNGEWVSEPRYYTPSGKVGFVNDPSDIFDVITAGTFGRWATKEGKAYLENGGKYLSDQATRQLEALGGDQAAYNAVIAMRDMQGIPGVDNSKALQKRKYLEDQGLWDTFAENMDGEWGDYGLNKTVGNASEDEFNKLYSEVFGEGMRLDVASAAGMKETLDTEEKESKTDANLDFLAGTPFEKAAIQNLDMDEDVLQTVTDLGYDYKTIKQIDDYIDNTDSLRKEDGSAIRNTKALQMRQYYEEMGVYDDIFQYISENGLDPQDYGLNKTVMGYSDSKFESQYSKYYGGSSSSSSSKSSGSSSSGSSGGRKSSGRRKSSKKKGFSSEEEMKAFFDQLVANIGLSSSKSSTSAINNILKKSKNLRNTKFSKRSS